MPEDVETKLDLALLGVVPRSHQSTPDESLADPKSPISEAYNSLRGSLLYSTPEGLREMTHNAVLNANYLLAILNDTFEVPFGERCMHEFVASARQLKREKRITAMDIGKRLLDYGYHAPTVYFPLVVPEAMMIEPTETESKQTLDAFAAAMNKIRGEEADFLRDAPHTTPISRPDEIKAAKEPILRWKP